MPKDPAFLFYPGDWMGGTQWMTFEQKGCYFELLILQFNTSQFTEAQAKQVLSICFDVAWPMLKQKFKCEGGFYYNVRLREEIEKRKKFTESRRSNGLSEKNKLNSKEASAKHMPKHMENENENENKVNNEKGVIGEKRKVAENIPFESFWHLYDKKVDKKPCEQKWNKLSTTEQQQILNYLPSYKISTPDKQFRKDPETFLNRRSWENEIIKTNTNAKHNAKSTDYASIGNDYDAYASITKMQVGT